MAKKGASPRATGPVAYLVILGGFALGLSLMKPCLGDMTDRSREAECMTNLEFIAEAVERMGPIACGPWPEQVPSEHPQAWSEMPLCFRTLGFEDELQLWGRYALIPLGDGWTATCALRVGGKEVVFEASDARTAARRPE